MDISVLAKISAWPIIGLTLCDNCANGFDKLFANKIELNDETTIKDSHK